MSARDAVLGRIKAKIAGSNSPARRAAVANRLSGSPSGIIPKRGQLDRAGRVDLFCEKSRSVAATVTQVGSYAEVAEEVATYLRERNLPQAVRSGSDSRLEACGWENTPQMQRDHGPADKADETGLSHAFGGVAETGTVLMTSGADNPTSVNFLPENHIIVVNADDIAGDYESVLGNIRHTYGQGSMPRTVNMITGPSRSGDIEQTILLGAHGPRSVHVIVVDEQQVD